MGSSRAAVRALSPKLDSACHTPGTDVERAGHPLARFARNT